ncbi:MAG: head maturation protease, ClpP-related [Sphingobium sp.]
MTIRQLPEARTFARPQNFQWDAPSDVLAQWAEKPLAAADDKDNIISIYDVIGEDWWTGGGFTAKRMANALRSIGDADVVVNINSPGGDMFEGIAIYNMLREHQARVTVNVMGWAASAASIIAMAGDEIRVGLGTFVMVHNAWGGVIGNRHDFAEASKVFEGFDSAIADIYQARTGLARDEIVKLMDAETFMGPSDAVKNGFADTIANEIDVPEGDAKNMDRGLMARRQTEAALARAGFSRSDRSQMIAAMTGQRDAPPAARDAGIDVAALKRLISAIQ